MGEKRGKKTKSPKRRLFAVVEKAGSDFVRQKQHFFPFSTTFHRPQPVETFFHFAARFSTAFSPQRSLFTFEVFDHVIHQSAEGHIAFVKLIGLIGAVNDGGMITAAQLLADLGH